MGKTNYIDDYINKEAVLDLIADYDLSMGQVVRGIHALPSITPQGLKTGHWYRQTNDFVDYYECSECGMAIGLYDVKNYCPNCGSRNEVEE